MSDNAARSADPGALVAENNHAWAAMYGDLKRENARLITEVERLRKRTHEIQETADKRFGKLERTMRWTRDIFRRAREAYAHNQREEDGKLRYLNASAWDQTAWTIEFTMHEQETLAAEAAGLREALAIAVGGDGHDYPCPAPERPCSADCITVRAALDPEPVRE